MTRYESCKKSAHLLIQALSNKAIEIFGEEASEEALIAMWLVCHHLGRQVDARLHSKYPVAEMMLPLLEEELPDA